MKSLFKYISFIFLLGRIIFPSEAQTDANQVIAIGRNVLSMDDYMLSIQYFNQAIKAKPYLYEPYYYRAIAKISLEDYAGAEQDCSLAIERNKYKVETYRARGFARQQLGLDSLAVEDYKIGLQSNPNDKYFLFYKSVAEAEMKRYEDADSTFAHLLALYPKFEEGYAARGRMLALRGDTAAALRDIDISISMSPSNLQPYLIRADIRAKNKDWKGASDDMDEAIKLSPREPDFYLNRAFLRYNLDDFFGAMADYNYTLELEPYNDAALFNRALLRYQVHDLPNAARDFEQVLKLHPNNFYALFNLGLINMERRNYAAAIRNFQTITKRYPKFHTAFYAIAQAYQSMGNTRAALENMYHADDLVRAYVKNPRRNPLDRPTIESGITRDAHADEHEETEADVMDRYNRLVTVGSVADTQLSFNDRIKGRVQDRDINVDLAPAFCLSFANDDGSLLTSSSYFPQLEEFNTGGYVAHRLYLTAGIPVPEEGYDAWFDLNDAFAKKSSLHGVTAADWLALATSSAMLKDYDSALRALDKSVELYPDFVLALLERGYVRQMTGDSHQTQLALADYDAALRVNPRLGIAWYNKGNLYSSAGDYTSALDCYNRALEMQPDMPQALFNRGVTYFRLGNKRQAFADLSRAGELGILPSYNLLKRMK